MRGRRGGVGEACNGTTDCQNRNLGVRDDIRKSKKVSLLTCSVFLHYLDPAPSRDEDTSFIHIDDLLSSTTDKLGITTGFSEYSQTCRPDSSKQ